MDRTIEDLVAKRSDGGENATDPRGVEDRPQETFAAQSPMPKQTTDVDRLVGLRITALRKARGMSQTALGSAVGVTFQQVQKYEKGQNRVGAGRLREMARLLDVPVSAFFEDGQPEGGAGSEVLGLLNDQGAAELLRAYAQIADEQMRRELLAVVRSAARLTRQQAAADGEAAE
jgi:transcriptional regulator with XRE-family HTH domain